MLHMVYSVYSSNVSIYQMYWRISTAYSYYIRSCRCDCIFVGRFDPRWLWWNVRFWWFALKDLSWSSSSTMLYMSVGSFDHLLNYLSYFSEMALTVTVVTVFRYTLFIPLYPVGMVAEIVLMLKALPFLRDSKLNSIALPNAYNFAFDYHLFIQVCSLLN